MITIYSVILFLIVDLSIGAEVGGPFLNMNSNQNIIKHEGYYYSAYDDGHSVNIYRSVDLETWYQLAEKVINDDNFPIWADRFLGTTQPRLVAISNENFRIYFTALNSVTLTRTIGVAFSNAIEGPYYTINKPLDMTPYFPEQSTILNDNGDLYLVAEAGGSIVAKPLLRDGLSVADNETVVLLEPTLSWEVTWIGTPFMVFKNDYYYIFYSNSQDCIYESSIGVARSESVLGPYEKMGDPILSSTDQESSPFVTGVMKDLTGKVDLLEYSVYDFICVRKSLRTAELRWRNNGWPRVASELA